MFRTIKLHKNDSNQSHMFVLFLCNAFCKIVKFDILYERTENPGSSKLNEFLITKLLDEYNTKFSEIDIQFKLESFKMYSAYFTLPEYREFSRLVGSSNLEEKAGSISKIHKNLIVLFSSEKSENLSKINVSSFCDGRFFVNLRESSVNDGIVKISIEAIRMWIEYVLEIKLPDVYDLKDFSLKNLVDEDVIENVFNCPINSKKGKKAENFPSETDNVLNLSIKKPMSRISNRNSNLISVNRSKNVFNKSNRIILDKNDGIKSKLKGNVKTSLDGIILDNNAISIDNTKPKLDRNKELKKKTLNTDSNVVISHSEDRMLKKFIFPDINTINVNDDQVEI